MLNSCANRFCFSYFIFCSFNHRCGINAAVYFILSLKENSPQLFKWIEREMIEGKEEEEETKWYKTKPEAITYVQAGEEIGMNTSFIFID